jgi:hypothetical protein
MKRYLAAAALVGISSASAFGEEAYFVVYDNTMSTCTILTEIPADKERYKVMGKYASATDANNSMAQMKDCY